MSVQPGIKAQTSWLLSAMLYVLLLLTISLDHWLWSRPEVDSLLLIWSIRTVPLLIFLPAVVTRNGRGFAWLGFVLLYYFTSGVVSGWAHGSWVGWLLAGESLLLFLTTILFVRWHFQGK